MTREETIKILCDGECENLIIKFHGGRSALDLALTVLRTHTREMVERMRGEWERIVDGYGKTEGFLCKCGCQSYSASKFCPSCGQPKTDEAVDMMLERRK